MSSTMYQLFKLQFVNAYTKEILREATYDNVEKIYDRIKAFEGTTDVDEDSYIFDSQHRTLVAEYQNYTTLAEGNIIIYKLYFKTRLSEIQVPILK